MSDTVNINTMEEPKELIELKEKADLMGIKYSKKISIEALKQKINEHVENANLANESKQEILKIKEQIFKENMKLVRCRITCLDPNRDNLKGEFITVANSYLGTVTKFVPYNTPAAEAYHLPYIIYKRLKKLKYAKREATDKLSPNDTFTDNYVMRPAFNVDVLEPLTEKELNELALVQARTGSID